MAIRHIGDLSLSCGDVWCFPIPPWWLWLIMAVAVAAYAVLKVVLRPPARGD